MADLTRRAFLGKTLLTGATIAVGGLSTTSTTPVKPVATATATTWKNLNVLSPKAKAYRTFLRGVSASAGFGKVNRKSLITKDRIGTGKNQAIAAQSPARQAFETAIKKPEASHTRIEARQGVGNPSANRIAQKIIPNPELKKHPSTRNWAISGDYQNAQRATTAKLNRDARQSHATELRKFRKANPDRMHERKSAQMHAENTKTKKRSRGYGGGGGKHMIDGVETPRNPTGMSLLNRKSILM